MTRDVRSETPPDIDRAPSAVIAEGEAFWIEVGPVDLDGEIVAIQRREQLIAALSPRADGRLRVASFRPLDRRAVLIIRSLAARPQFGGFLKERRTNWDYALDCSALVASHHSVDTGVSYLAYWRTGLGIDGEGHFVPAWRPQKDLLARPAELTVAELAARDFAS
ncbi:MAG: hypothetical protein RLZZ200_940 [Pseudomonadota bacterium]|jgi:hypothetical protein